MTRMRTYESLLFCSALLCVGGFTVNQHKCSVVDRDGLLCELKGEQHERIEGDRLLRGLKKIEFSGFAGRMINLTESYFPDLQSVMIDSSLPEACSRIWTSTNVTVLVNQRRCRSIEVNLLSNKRVIPESFKLVTTCQSCYFNWKFLVRLLFQC